MKSAKAQKLSGSAATFKTNLTALPFIIKLLQKTVFTYTLPVTFDQLSRFIGEEAQCLLLIKVDLWRLASLFWRGCGKLAFDSVQSFVFAGDSFMPVWWLYCPNFVVLVSYCKSVRFVQDTFPFCGTRLGRCERMIEKLKTGSVCLFRKPNHQSHL